MFRKGLWYEKETCYLHPYTVNFAEQNVGTKYIFHMSTIQKQPEIKNKLVILTIQRVQIFVKDKNSENSCEVLGEELYCYHLKN